jgi:hypothetical protein
VLLTVYGWHFAAAALTIFHDMLDRLDGAVAGTLRKSSDVRVDGPRVYRKDHLVHCGEYGAYLDAMGAQRPPYPPPLPPLPRPPA